jgi:DNA-binding response OmpR family regulator
VFNKTVIYCTNNDTFLNVFRVRTMPHTILLVEDEAPIREMLSFVLEQAGFDVVEAEDYDIALKKVVEPYPDLILLDWMLPGGSGVQLSKKLKEHEFTREIPVIMLTARGANGDVLEMGPTEFKLLHFFMTHTERVYSRELLLDNVWGTNVYVEDRTVDVHIRRLRKTLSKHGHDAMIQTVRGAGYRFSNKL